MKTTSLSSLLIAQHIEAPKIVLPLFSQSLENQKVISLLSHLQEPSFGVPRPGSAPWRLFQQLLVFQGQSFYP